MFSLASSLSKSLQHLLSALTQGGEDGRLVMFTSSVVLWGGRKQISLACVGSARSAWTTLGLPSSWRHVLSWSTLLRFQVAQQGHCPKWTLCFVHFPGLSCSGSGSQVLHRSTDSVGRAFCALPWSEQLRQPGAWRTHCPRWVMHLNHLPGPSCSGALSQVCCVALDVNCSGAQEDLVSNWEPAHSLVEDAGLWG